MVEMLGRPKDALNDLPAQLIYSHGSDLTDLILEFQELPRPLEGEQQRLLLEALGRALGKQEQELLGLEPDEAIALRAYETSEERSVVQQIHAEREQSSMDAELSEEDEDRLFNEAICSAQQRRFDGADAATETKSATTAQLQALLGRPDAACAVVSAFMGKTARAHVCRLHEKLQHHLREDAGVAPPPQLAIDALAIWEKVEARKEEAAAARAATLARTTLLLSTLSGRLDPACAAVAGWVGFEEREQLEKLLLARNALERTAEDCAAAAEAIIAAAGTKKEETAAARAATLERSVVVLLELQSAHDRQACEAATGILSEEQRSALEELLLACNALEKTAEDCAAAAEAIIAAAGTKKEEAVAARAATIESSARLLQQLLPNKPPQRYMANAMQMESDQRTLLESYDTAGERAKAETLWLLLEKKAAVSSRACQAARVVTIGAKDSISNAMQLKSLQDWVQCCSARTAASGAWQLTSTWSSRSSRQVRGGAR